MKKQLLLAGLFIAQGVYVYGASASLSREVVLNHFIDHLITEGGPVHAGSDPGLKALYAGVWANCEKKVQHQFVDWFKKNIQLDLLAAFPEAKAATVISHLEGYVLRKLESKLIEQKAFVEKGDMIASPVTGRSAPSFLTVVSQASVNTLTRRMMQLNVICVLLKQGKYEDAMVWIRRLVDELPNEELMQQFDDEVCALGAKGF